ncbi:hypothetical protein N9926_01175 [Flavobacteriaceae bacterium]|nr:hypothetical protein [Flavobacteriaceae bacterium]
MSTTYITLCNDLLRRLNEVAFVTSGDGFDTAKNVQAIAKDAINNAIREILQDGHQFPFLKTTATQTLTAGTGTYDFPADTASVDWDTFYLQALSSANNSARALSVVPFEQYVRLYKSIEENSGTSARTAPNIIYQTAEEKFGITPIPDAAYIVEYVYYKFPSDLILFSDTMIIPDRFKYIIIDGAMTYMMRFRSNEQSAQIHQQKFKEGVKSMRRLLLDDPLSVRSTVVNRPRYSSHMLSLSS